MSDTLEPADEPPIILRKKTRMPEEPHGGAWKVAYADFVTAMMAFFLLLWLLNVTTEDKKQGISDFFEPVCSCTSENARCARLPEPIVPKLTLSGSFFATASTSLNDL